MKSAKCNFTANLACFRRSDSKASKKNSRKKNEERLEGERGRERVTSLSPPIPPPLFSWCTTSLAPHLPPRSTIWTPGTGYCKLKYANLVEQNLILALSYCTTRSWSLCLYSFMHFAFFLTQWEKSTVIFPMRPCISFVCELFEQFLHDLSK